MTGAGPDRKDRSLCGHGLTCSLANSIKKLGYEFEWIKDASDFDKAEVGPGLLSLPLSTPATTSEPPLRRGLGVVELQHRAAR
jgi:hypothetical protein